MRKVLLFCALLIAFGGRAQNIDAIVDAAEAEMEKGNDAQAIEMLDKAIEKNPSAFELYHAKGRAHVGLKQYQKALDSYGEALRLNPTSAEVYNNRGMMLNAVGYPDEALADAENALKYASADRIKLSALNVRADAKRLKNDLDGAIKDYETILASNPTYHIELSASINVARAYGAQQKNKEAIARLETLTTRYPDASVGYTNLAFRYAEIGNYEKAIALNDKIIAMELKPTADRYGQAELLPNKRVESNSNTTVALAYNNKGYAQYKAGKLKDAITSINQSMALYPENPYAYRNRALVYLAQHNNAAACLDIAKSLELGFTDAYGDEVQKLKEANCK